MLDATIEKNNNERIKYLVKEHFSLSEESYNFFSKEIDSRTILSTYKDFLEKNNSNNLRASFDLPIIYREKLDNGWSLFKNIFGSFCILNSLTYENFVNNKILINKNEMKLRKAMVSFYTKKENYPYTARDIFRVSSISDKIAAQITTIIDNVLLEVSKICLPKSSIKMVVSLNFADWFLCSTAENWRSCLNLESDFHASYWAGLPGLIGDKNRCMVYITDGNTKTYQGITVERIIARSWGMLGDNNKVYIIKPYPLQNLFDYRTVKEVTGLNTESFERTGGYVSKQPADLLYFNSTDAKKSAFIFQDLVGFHSDYKGTICYQGRNGFYTYINDKLHIGKQIINYSGGFSNLIKNNEKIEKYFIKPAFCSLCGSLVDSERAERIEIYNDETNQIELITVCKKCLYSMIRCEHCGVTHRKDSKHLKQINGTIICVDCFKKNYFECEDCGNIHRKNEAKRIKDKYGDIRKICKSCFEKWYQDSYSYCEVCNSYNLNKYMKNVNSIDGFEMMACENCLKHSLSEKQLFLKL
jgi:hypothetical protein